MSKMPYKNKQKQRDYMRNYMKNYRKLQVEAMRLFREYFKGKRRKI